MPSNISNNKIIFTNKARCRDCNRCVRVCPVKAIKVKNGQAYVDESKCVYCGLCVKECPQKAKSYRKDGETLRELLKSGNKIAASVAPSFPSAFVSWELKRLPSALRKIGFNYVLRTAEGAYCSALKTKDIYLKGKGKSLICSACSAAVFFIEKYETEITDVISKSVSPMIAHAKIIKKRYGEKCRVVFIGPCSAKKAEAERPEYNNLIDAVLTFDELIEFFKEELININMCEESEFDDLLIGKSALFPLSGGLLKTAEFNEDAFNPTLIFSTGFEELQNAVKYIKKTNALIEPLFCKGGCINGPGVPDLFSIYERRRAALKYSEESIKVKAKTNFNINLLATFNSGAQVKKKRYSEEDIKKTLSSTGKNFLEDELNCGSCGYDSCRDKAIAVLDGLAEAEMCVPYMRRLAEKKTDKIIDTSPNGILILDVELNIVYMNPAFKIFFRCSEAIVGKRISYLINPEQFEELAASENSLIEAVINYEKYGIICHQKLYKLTEEKQYVGIFIDITKSAADEKKLNALKIKTARQAQELLDHQITMAQELAKFLGQSAARGEELVENLLKIAGDEENRNGERNLWDTFMLRR